MLILHTRKSTLQLGTRLYPPDGMSVVLKTSALSNTYRWQPKQVRVSIRLGLCVSVCEHVCMRSGTLS